MPPSANPLIHDRDIDFQLYEVHRVEDLCALPAFADHSRETFDLMVSNTRRLAREVLFPAYKPMDEQPAVLRDGRVTLHPTFRELYPRLVDLGLVSAARPVAVGGQQLPLAVATLASAYLAAANLNVAGLVGLTTGAAHLLEAFGDEALRERFMTKLYSGEWTGTMALTEPHAGSSLADVSTVAVPTPEGYYLLRGQKIFISGGDHDLTDNIVNMTLARIEGAPPGIRGVSLFAVPRWRTEHGARVENDVHTAGLVHKIGWKGLPSLILSLGEQNDCRGWLVGTAGRGVAHMFQMMNEARILVGMSATATASAAYHESVMYARTRVQGRGLGARDGSTAQVPIIEHADVRRMLLRQKSIVEGSLSLLCATARFADLAEHGDDEATRHRARLLLDLLTPVAKSFPAEKGFESNALAVQIHGGYGYSSEYLPESWLRDQKLNSIHEGTTGIQGLDLLGRKVVAEGGAALQAFLEEVGAACERARRAGVDPAWGAALERAAREAAELTATLGARALGGEVDFMLRHSADYLELFSVIVVAWQWLAQAAAAAEGAARGGRGTDDAGFYEGKRCAAQYWFATELPRAGHLMSLCREGEDSYARMQPAWFP